MARNSFIIVLMVVGLFLVNCSSQLQVSANPIRDKAKLSYPHGVFESKLELVKKNYLKSLRSDNPGVVESAVFYVVKFKLFYPEMDCSELSAELDRLAVNGPSPRIRYKAQIAGNFLHNSEWLAAIAKLDYKDADQFFAILAEELQSKILAYEN